VSEAEEVGLRPPLAVADPPIIDDASPEDQPDPAPDEGTPHPAEPAPRRAEGTVAHRGRQNVDEALAGRGDRARLAVLLVGVQGERAWK
jgi:hypothetical protein